MALSCRRRVIRSCWVNALNYAQDLLSQHSGVVCKSTPFPGSLDEEPEVDVKIDDVRAAQGVVGELLWLSCRTRPDLSFGVA